MDTDLRAALQQSLGTGFRIEREIQLIAKLQHPHVVPVLSAGDAGGALYYVMPFLSGESLRNRDGPVGEDSGCGGVTARP